MKLLTKKGPIQKWRKAHTKVAEGPYKSGGNSKKYISMIYKAKKFLLIKYLTNEKIKIFSFSIK